MTAALALALVAAAAPSNYAPQPLIDWAEPTGFVKPGTTITFDSSPSSDPDGTVVARAWDLDGDREYDDGNGVTASWTFSAEGSHVVRLSVVDDKGSPRRTRSTCRCAT